MYLMKWMKLLYTDFKKCFGSLYYVKFIVVAAHNR